MVRFGPDRGQIGTGLARECYGLPDHGPEGVFFPVTDSDSKMYLLKGSLAWQSLAHHLRDVPEYPAWTPLTEYPLRRLTGKLQEARVFYMPAQLPVTDGKTLGWSYRPAA